MTDRLLYLIGAWVFVVGPVAWIAFCAHRGFDPGLCEAYRACDWRQA